MDISNIYLKSENFEIFHKAELKLVDLEINTSSLKFCYLKNTA